MATINLLQTSSIVLDENGNGTCPGIGPQSPGSVWTVTVISVQCSSNNTESIANVYLQGILIGTSTWGSTGDSDTGISQQVFGGQLLTCTWTGGDPGATAIMGVTGTATV